MSMKRRLDEAYSEGFREGFIGIRDAALIMSERPPSKYETWAREAGRVAGAEARRRGPRGELERGAWRGSMR